MLKILVPTPLFGKRRMINFGRGGKRESRLDVCSTFERMEMNKDNVGSLKS
jgi:hypothetical protein